MPKTLEEQITELTEKLEASEAQKKTANTQAKERREEITTLEAQIKTLKAEGKNSVDVLKNLAVAFELGEDVELESIPSLLQEKINEASTSDTDLAKQLQTEKVKNSDLGKNQKTLSTKIDELVGANKELSDRNQIHVVNDIDNIIKMIALEEGMINDDVTLNDIALMTKTRFVSIELSDDGEYYASKDKDHEAKLSDAAREVLQTDSFKPFINKNSGGLSITTSRGRAKGTDALFDPKNPKAWQEAKAKEWRESQK